MYFVSKYSLGAVAQKKPDFKFSCVRKVQLSLLDTTDYEGKSDKKAPQGD